MFKMQRFFIADFLKHSSRRENRWVDRLLQLDAKRARLFCQKRLHSRPMLGRPSLQESEIFFLHRYGEQCHEGKVRSPMAKSNGSNGSGNASVSLESKRPATPLKDAAGRKTKTGLSPLELDAERYRSIHVVPIAAKLHPGTATEGVLVVERHLETAIHDRGITAPLTAGCRRDRDPRGTCPRRAVR